MDAPEKGLPATPKAEKTKPAQKRTGPRRDERPRRRTDSHEASQASDKGSIRRSDTAAGSQQNTVMSGTDDRSQFSRRSSTSRRSRRSASREFSKVVPSENATARAEVEAAVPEVSSRPEMTPSIQVVPPPRVAASLILPLAGDTADAAPAPAPSQQQDETLTSAPAAPGSPTQPSTRRASKQLEEEPAGTQATATEPQPEEAPDQQQAEDAARLEAHQTARFSNAPVHEDERPESKRPVVIAAVAIIVFVLVVAILKQLRAAPADVAVCVGQGCANSSAQAI
ncbi:uncharacterized protein [Dermacentor andersoni]|uniref:uncharacterized protein n=1 Tax=Dermacentor andersoni TaxID=34620 RepID=UPI002155750A|nr:brain acid soluble protein 1-like [Dermacentor andersoni]